MTTVSAQVLKKERIKRKALRRPQKANTQAVDVTCWGRLFQVRPINREGLVSDSGQLCTTESQ